MGANKKAIFSNDFILSNRFEGQTEPQAINKETLREILRQQVPEKRLTLYTLSQISNINKFIKKLVCHALIQRSLAYKTLRQQVPDILAFNSKLPKLLLHCRQVISSDQNYNAYLLQKESFDNKSYKQIAILDPKHMIAELTASFDKQDCFLSKDEKKYVDDLFLGDELFHIPNDLSIEAISLKPSYSNIASRLEQIVKISALTPNGLSATKLEFAQIFPKLRAISQNSRDIKYPKLLQDEEQLSQSLSDIKLPKEVSDYIKARVNYNSMATIDLETTANKVNEVNEIDFLLSQILKEQTDFHNLWFKGWKLALKGEKLGLFIAFCCAFLGIDAQDFDVDTKFHRAFLQLQLAAAHSEPLSCFMLAWLCKKQFTSVFLNESLLIRQSYLQRAANLGLDLALVEYANLKDTSPVNEDLAKKYLLLAARQLHPLAIRESSCIVCSKYNENEFDFQNFEFGWLLFYLYHLLQPKDMSIFCSIGIMFLNGQGVAINKNYALKVFQRLTFMSLTACYMLGFMYFYGNGVDIDYEKSRYYFKLTAPYDIFDSNALLAYLYESGQGGPMDKDEAIRCYSAGLWSQQGSLREYCAERLLHFELKKLQEMLETSDIDAQNLIRTKIMQIIRLCIHDFPKSSKAWQMRLQEFEKAKKLTDLSYFNG